MFQLLLAIIYLAFISFGLPDGLLGSAWPFMYVQFDVPVSYSGIIFMIISASTILSSLMSDRMTKWLGTGKVTACSVALTAIALFGFSTCHSFWLLCIWAIPYGLGAGGVDASINNYAAIHYESSHMSWLHCMWGVGATVGPYIMSIVLSGGKIWNTAYRYVGIFQVVLTAVLIFSLPLWKERRISQEEQADAAPLKLRDIFAIDGAKEILIMFFCYCAVEQTAGLWASSYLVLGRGVDAETAAGFASLFYIGITVGRAVSGFIAMKLNDEQMIWLGMGMITFGIAMLILPVGNIVALVGLIIIGLGCAPIYPCIIHSTPARFGADKSQAIIGIQMAFAYIGTCLMPPLFGVIADLISIKLFPIYMLVILVLMIIMHKQVCQKTAIVVRKKGGKENCLPEGLV